MREVSVSTHGNDGSAITAIVVTYRSSAVIAECLERLQHAAPRRGVEVVVVDNSSADGTAELAERALGTGGRVVRRAVNGGYAAGVNAGIAAARTPWIAVLNPDTRVPEAGLDRLADLLESYPRAGLIAPRVRDGAGRPETTIGWFPTVARERAHSWLADRFGLPGRMAPFPPTTARVEWASGCAWLLRRSAVEDVGPLDEGYFMYFEDVDYCRRLHDAGWDVMATPEVEIEHDIGGGSDGTVAVPADGGLALVRYFSKFHPDVPADSIRALLARGWRLRWLWRAARAALGDRVSARVAARYRLALARLAST